MIVGQNCIYQVHPILLIEVVLPVHTWLKESLKCF